MKLCKRYTIIVLLLFFFVLTKKVDAVLDSCSASISNHTLTPDSTTSINISVQNQSDADAAKAVITRPGGSYHLSSSGVDGCSTDQGDAEVSVTCNIAPSASINIPISVLTDGEAPSETWGVRMLDSSGAQEVECGGDFSSSIKNASGGGSSFSISAISASGSVTSASISWTTDVSANSSIEYGATDSYGSNKSSSDLVTSHSLSLSGLSSNTTYHYRLASVDGSNNSISSGDNTFTTSEAGIVTSITTSSTTSSSRVTPTPTLPPDITPPTVYLANNFTKPVAQTPLITGSATDDRNISKVEYSIDGGVNWYTAQFTRSQDLKTAYFSFKPSIKDDGNYKVVARASDAAQNSAISQRYVLIFDTIPPKIGGSIITSGPQIIRVNPNGIISLPSHVGYTMLFSSIGGATDIVLIATPGGKTKSQPLRFTATKNEFTNIWSTGIQFDNSGDYTLTAEAIDGADNRTTTRFAPVHVLQSGSVKSRGRSIKDAHITVYYYNQDSNAFLLWDGKAYAQDNPVLTDKYGNYSFMLPKGKYYVEVDARGYKKLVSDIFSFSETAVLNSDFELSKYPYMNLGFLKIPIPFVSSDTQRIILKREKILNQYKAESEKIIGKKIRPTGLVSNGKQITEEFFKGKKTILGFTNTWLPQTQVIIESLRSEKKYQTAIVMPNESDSFIQTYKKRGNYSIPFISDANGDLLEFLNMRMLPGYVMIDENGIVKDLRIGVFSMDNN